MYPGGELPSRLSFRRYCAEGRAQAVSVQGQNIVFELYSLYVFTSKYLLAGSKKNLVFQRKAHKYSALKRFWSILLLLVLFVLKGFTTRASTFCCQNSITSSFFTFLGNAHTT